MTPLVFDLETTMPSPSRAQEIVCVSWALGDAPARVAFARDLEEVLEAILDHDGVLVGHNVAGFDLVRIFNQYPQFKSRVLRLIREERVQCTLIRERIRDIQTGRLNNESASKRKVKGKSYGYSLADCARLHFDVEVDGKDTTRTEYGQFLGASIDEVPPDYLEYALRDVELTRDLYVQQGEVHPLDASQTSAQFALGLVSDRGILVDGPRVAEVKEIYQERFEALRELLLGAKLLRYQGPKKDPKRKICRHMAAIRNAVSVAYDGDPPVSVKKNIKTDRDTLETAAALVKCTCGTPKAHSADCPAVVQYVADYVSTQKILTTYVSALETALAWDGRLHGRYNTVVSSLRTSSYSPNLQNLPARTGKEIRPCLIPTPGFVFLAADYSTLELRTLAQSVIDVVGHSRMADEINAGVDVHSSFAARFLAKIPYEDFMERLAAGDKGIKLLRTSAKGSNFGLPGLLGAKGLVAYLRGYGLKVSLDEAALIREAWYSYWTGCAEMLALIREEIPFDSTGDLWLPRHGILRGNLTATSYANGKFQTSGGIGAKAATVELTLDCHDEERASPLLGSHILNMVHDELLLEVPVTSDLDACGRELSRVMEETMQWIATPDVKQEAEAWAMTRWDKAAERVVDENGRLIPWVG